MPSKQQLSTLTAFCTEIGNCNITEDTYFACANFLFYTAWFEERIFTAERDKRQSPSTSKIIAEQLFPQLDLTKYDQYGNYFVQRYLNDPEASKHRHALQFQDIHSLESILIDYRDNQSRNSNLLWIYLMIAYRFRNNMFHGSKGLINLNKYREQFNLLNHFWDQLLRDINRIGYYGFNSGTK